jgi:hypothetical protein
MTIMLPTFFLQEPGHRYTLSVAAEIETNARLAMSADGNIAAKLSADLRRERAEAWQSRNGRTRPTCFNRYVTSMRAQPRAAIQEKG